MSKAATHDGSPEESAFLSLPPEAYADRLPVVDAENRLLAFLPATNVLAQNLCHRRIALLLRQTKDGRGLFALDEENRLGLPFVFPLSAEYSREEHIHILLRERFYLRIRSLCLLSLLPPAKETVNAFLYVYRGHVALLPAALKEQYLLLDPVELRGLRKTHLEIQPLLLALAKTVQDPLLAALA